MHMTAGGRAAALLQGREGLPGRVQQERLAHRQAGADHAAVVGSVFQQKRWRLYYASQRINRVTAYLILCFFSPNVRARTRRLASKQPRCAADHLLLANALQHSWLQKLLCTHSGKLCALYTMWPSPTPNKQAGLRERRLLLKPHQPASNKTALRCCCAECAPPG
jgi:hypothetical protein